MFIFDNLLLSWML